MFRTWKIRDGDGGRAGAFQFERLAIRVTLWRAILAAVAVGSYLLGLLIFLPAEAATPRGRDAVGTVWKGEMALGQGFAAGWSIRPFTSLARFGLAGRLAVRGPETALMGQALLRPGLIRLEDLNGAAAARLISVVAPGLPFICDADLSFAVPVLAIKGSAAGQGQVRSSAGSCAGRDGTPASTPLPPLDVVISADAEATSVELRRAGAEPVLARARIAPDGRLTTTIEPAGVGVLPGAVAPVTIETAL
jgi:hypothetical protein